MPSADQDDCNPSHLRDRMAPNRIRKSKTCSHRLSLAAWPQPPNIGSSPCSSSLEQPYDVSSQTTIQWRFWWQTTEVNPLFAEMLERCKIRFGFLLWYNILVAEDCDSMQDVWPCVQTLDLVHSTSSLVCLIERRYVFIVKGDVSSPIIAQWQFRWKTTEVNPLSAEMLERYMVGSHFVS